LSAVKEKSRKMTNFATKPIPDEKPEIVWTHRPWGQQKQYAYNQECTVTYIVVEADHRLSLQSHSGRAELWIALDDGAIIQVGDQITAAKAGDEFWIPPNTKHRLSSPGYRIRVLEVGFGNWKQEDITRYEDDYNRPVKGE
jgi:mannose-1-phosphate guanylyltransferase/mannose-6-phosphate isomerase